MTIGIGSIEGKETSYTAIEKKPGVDVIFVRDVKKKRRESPDGAACRKVARTSSQIL